MAELMKSYGVMTGYNLDVGDSSTMYSNGQVINKPTHKRKQNLRKGGERYRLHRLPKNLLVSTFHHLYWFNYFSLIFFTFVYELFSYYDLSANRTGMSWVRNRVSEILIKFSNRGCIKCLFS